MTGSSFTRFFAVALLAAVALVALFAWVAPSRLVPGGARGAARTGGADPIAESKRQLFAAAAQRPSDPDLVALYEVIDEDHFAGGLPPVAVKWEDALDALSAGDGYRLEGMTDGKTILVSTALEGNDEELRRTLCHEAVHVKLQASSRDARHDAAFQQELQRVFESGCFQAILATPEEQAELKQWLDAESARLKEQGSALDATRESLDREVAEINAAVEDLNARVAAANERQSGWPPDAERETLAVRRASAEERKAEFNAAVQRHNEASAELARRGERYRLMLAYPHGVDDVRRE